MLIHLWGKDEGAKNWTESLNGKYLFTQKSVCPKKCTLIHSEKLSYFTPSWFMVLCQELLRFQAGIIMKDHKRTLFMGRISKLYSIEQVSFFIQHSRSFCSMNCYLNRIVLATLLDIRPNQNLFQINKKFKDIRHSGRFSFPKKKGGNPTIKIILLYEKWFLTLNILKRVIIFG